MVPGLSSRPAGFIVVASVGAVAVPSRFLDR
jgi:hypothetical protein